MKGLQCLFVLMAAVLVSCGSKLPAYTMTSADPFDMSAVDSIDSVYGCRLDSVLSDGKPTLLYVCSNECSACISAFVDFHAKVRSSETDSLDVVYWVYGCDSYSFEYYMEQADISMRHHEWLVMDTLDVFHNVIPDYYSNTLFLVKPDKTMLRIAFEVPEYEWDLDGVIDSDLSRK